MLHFKSRKSSLALFALAAFTLLLSTNLAARADQPPPPVVAYLFNESGATAANSGSVGDALEAQLTMRGKGDTDLHTPPGGGVSGQTADRAFDNGADGMAVGGTIPKLSLMRFYTLYGWLKTPKGAKSIPLGARLIDNQGESGGFSLSWAGAGKLRLQITGQDQYVDSDPVYTGTEWICFAVVVDLVRNTVSFYKGTTDADAALASAGYGGFPAARMTTLNSAKLVLGNSPGGKHPFPGLLDDIRIYGLTLEEDDIDFLRGKDLRP